MPTRRKNKKGSGRSSKKRGGGGGGGGRNNNNNNNNNNQGFGPSFGNGGGYSGSNNGGYHGGRSGNGRGGTGKGKKNTKGPPADIRKLNGARMGHCPEPQNPQQISQAIDQHAIRALWFDEGSNQVITAGADAKVRYWSLQGQQTKEVPVRGKVWSLHMVSPFLFVGMEVPTGQPSPGDKQGLIQAFNTTSAQSWELKMNEQTPFSHGTRVSAMVAKGQFLFSGGGMFPNEPATPDNAIRVWQLNPQTQQFGVAKTMNGHQASIKSMTLTSDGAWLVSGDMSGTICTWNSSNGNPGRMTRQAHIGEMPFVMSVLPFPGNTLITASYGNGEVKVWNHNAQGELQPTPGVRTLSTGGNVCSITSTTDKNNQPVLVVGGGKGIVKCYDLGPSWKTRGMWFPHSSPLARKIQKTPETWCVTGSSKNNAFFTAGTDSTANCYLFLTAQEAQQQQQQRQQQQQQQHTQGGAFAGAAGGMFNQPQGAFGQTNVYGQQQQQQQHSSRSPPQQNQVAGGWATATGWGAGALNRF